MESDFVDREAHDDNNDFDIIIIGAGITGLTSAHVLLKKEAGLDVLVLEARESIGGRVFLTEESKCYHAHSLQKNISQILQELNIQFFPKRRNHAKKTFLTKNGPIYNLSSYHAFQVYNFLLSMEKISSDFKMSTYKNHENASVLAKMSLDELSSHFLSGGNARSICRSLLSISCGLNNLKKVSALWYLVMVNGAEGFLQKLRVALGDENRFFLKGGMAQLVTELSKKIKSNGGVIKCSEPVLKIQFNDIRAYVSTNKKCYRCDYVVLAVPPPVSNEIIIQSSLSTNLSKAQIHFENGTNVFFTATLKEEFWSDKNNYLRDVVATPECDSNLKLAYDATHSNDKSQPVYAGFLSESDSQTLEKYNLFDSLSKCFRSNVAENCREYKERKWMPVSSSNDKDAIRGGSPMSFLNPCDLINHLNPLILPHKRIVFTASEYAMKWPGTVDGAIEAGKIASFLVLWNIRPQTLNRFDLAIFSTPVTRFQHTGIEFYIIYYMCLITNICIFWSFFRSAY